MKYASTFLKALMAMLIAVLPLQADAKPKEDGRKGGNSAGEVRKSAGNKAKVSSARKASSQPKRNATKAPSQRKQNISKSPSRPKQSVSKSQRRQASSPQRSGKKAAAVQKQKPQKRHTAQVQPSRQSGKARARDRQQDGGRDISHSDRKAQKSTREQRVAAGSGEREGTGAGKKQDLLANDRNRGDKRGVDGERGNREDRRPPRDNSAEERQRRAERNELRDQGTKVRKQQVAQRHEQKRDKVENFRKHRNARVAALKNHRQTLRSTRTNVDREYVRVARNEIREYWDDRGDDVRYYGYDRCDDLFDDDWWEDCHWRSRPILVSNPWWWWRPAEWTSVNVFLDMGWSEPMVYDYGTDVIYDDTAVYYHGESLGTPVEYSQSVIQLANPTVDVIAEAPVVEEEWTPLGVWALVQEEQGDAVMFFQLSVNKTGRINGAYVNVVSGEELPVIGQVDRATQRAAWHIGDRTEKVFEAGVTNLTQNQASCLVHISPGEMQPWLLVRMEGPDLPSHPTTLSQTAPGSLIP